jgi:hypothetical protein
VSFRLEPVAGEGGQDDAGGIDGLRESLSGRKPPSHGFVSTALQREAESLIACDVFDCCLLKNLGLTVMVGRGLLLRRQP